jgi:fatty-acyl-CoA synthase
MAPSLRVGDTDVPLLDETIGATLRRTARTHGDTEALVDVPTGRRWTYAQLDADVDRVCAGLLGLGLSQGDRLAIWSPNVAEWVLVQYATARLGVVLVTINPAYRAHELAYVLKQSGAAVLVAALRFKTSDYQAMVEQVRGDCPALQHVVHLDDPSWDALLAAPAAELTAYENGLTAADPINIQYTSGTTGFPKGATLSHRNILNNGLFIGQLLGYTSADRICVPVPFYHCFGMVIGNLAALTHAACVVVPGPAFEPAATLRAVAQERCTSLYGVPTMFIAELAEGVSSYDLSSLRTGVMAGSPCPTAVMEQVIADMGMTEVGICYGMTETSPVSTQTRADDDLDRRTSTVGQVHPHVEVKVVDADGEVVEEGLAGELCTRGYSVMLGYWDQPDLTAEAIDSDGWMHTGDLATMDEAGYLRIVGRIKDLVIRGGENVYPREVEEYLYSHPDVADVQVVGVPDPKYGEELLAAVRLRAGAAVTEEELREFCRGRIAHYKVPRYVRFVDEFPMTVTGKVQKFKMREQAVAELGLQDQQ